MRPDARVQSAIDLLDAIILAARDGGAAADVIASRFFKTRRYAGSADRRAIRDLAWAVIRRFGERPANGRAAMLALADGDAALAAQFTGAAHAPAIIDAAEARATGAAVPQWLMPHLDPRIDAGEQAALLERAPLDLRLNRARLGDIVLPEGAALGAPIDGLRLPHDSDVAAHPAVIAGAAVVQDAASQYVASLCDAPRHRVILDLCAGAGGKTLALAAANPDAHIIACDIDRSRLQRLAPRAEQMGATNIETRLLNPGQELAMLADLVGRLDLLLIDAPCSGSGTWRRNPEGRWRLTPKRLTSLTDAQARLLDIAGKLLAGRGTLVYAVCSLLHDEGEGQVRRWLNANPDWQGDWPQDWALGRVSGVGRILTPHHDGCDGFFVARLRCR